MSIGPVSGSSTLPTPTATLQPASTGTGLSPYTVAAAEVEQVAAAAQAIEELQQNSAALAQNLVDISV
ncbi:MAG TPA: hypothetical protein VMU42_12680 [Candidatus Sulfotelmatobacter sp.]|nr:hypothetical protein [Candidatus Sulfotelmatobacter sp.]